MMDGESFLIIPEEVSAPLSIEELPCAKKLKPEIAVSSIQTADCCYIFPAQVRLGGRCWNS